MRFTSRLSDVAGCDFIVENVPEVFAVKRAVHGELDAVSPPEVCFGVNTSCISITRIAGATGRADRIVGMHFMNPVYLKPAVEVIRVSTPRTRPWREPGPPMLDRYGLATAMPEIFGLSAPPLRASWITT